MKSLDQIFRRIGSALGRSLLFCVLPTFAFIALAIPARAQDSQGSINFNMTNTVTVGTITANMGDAIEVGPQRELSLQFEFTSTTTNVGSILLTFQRSRDGTTYETTPNFTWGVPINGTNLVVGWTNLPVSTIGAAKKIKLYSAAHSTSSGSLSSVALYAVKKRDKTVE